MKLILFDIDGTLIRVRADAHRRAIDELLGTLFDHHDGSPPVEMHGKTDRQIFLEIAGILGIDSATAEERVSDLDSALCAVWDRHLDASSVIVLEGVRELLDDLSARDDLRLGLLTGNLESCARRKLAPHGLDQYFPFGAFGSDAIDRNDLPPIALDRARTLHGLDIDFDRTLIIGDSHRDIACARAWGIRSLAVATGSLSVEDLLRHEPDAVCASLRDNSYIMNFLLEP